MILEIVTSLAMSGVLGYTFLEGKGVSEAGKIQRIAGNCGLSVKEGKETRTIHLMKRRKHSWGMEYVYRIPLGLSFEDFQRKRQNIEDGLNHKRGLFDLSRHDLQNLKLNGDIIRQIQQLLHVKKHRKEIRMDYDGTLRIRVYKDPMPELIPFDDDTLSGCRGWMVCVGHSREGTVYHDFDKIPHMVVAGTTRYGKSVFLKNVITTLVYSQPAHVTFTLLDLKGGLAFNRFANLKQVNAVAKDVDESLDALQSIEADMKQRQAEFLRKGYEDVKEAKWKRRHFIIIDEAAELASEGEPIREIKLKKSMCEHIISEIARIGGGLGYRLIFCTQYPTADTLPRQVKQNCDARLCFRLPTQTGSMVVLDEPGAESLPQIKGRAIYRTDKAITLQTPFIENPFIDRVIRPHITMKRKEVHNEPTDRENGSHTLIIE